MCLCNQRWEFRACMHANGIPDVGVLLRYGIHLNPKGSKRICRNLDLAYREIDSRGAGVSNRQYHKRMSTRFTTTGTPEALDMSTITDIDIESVFNLFIKSLCSGVVSTERCKANVNLYIKLMQRNEQTIKDLYSCFRLRVNCVKNILCKKYLHKQNYTHT